MDTLQCRAEFATADGLAESYLALSAVFFKPTEGDITVETELKNIGIGGPGSCQGEGRETFCVDQMTRGALRYMQLPGLPIGMSSRT